jgi:hypothetical protein
MTCYCGSLHAIRFRIEDAGAIGKQRAFATGHPRLLMGHEMAVALDLEVRWLGTPSTCHPSRRETGRLIKQAAPPVHW